jgi:phosphatidylglycerophosphate synthase
VNPKLWPNLATALRIALVPAVLTTAIAGSRAGFVGLVALALATDVLDGFLARRLNAYSEFGRKLDSIADYLMMLAGVAGIALLWPEIMRREIAWVATGLGAFFAVVVYGFVRLGRAPCYHTWATKTLVALCALSLIPLLAEWSAVPFRIVIALQVLAALEEMTISVLVPSHIGEMPTVWHALRKRRHDLAADGSRPETAAR